MSASTSEPNNLLISINPNLTTSELVNGSMPGEHLSNQVTWWHAMESQTYKLEMSHSKGKQTLDLCTKNVFHVPIIIKNLKRV